MDRKKENDCRFAQEKAIAALTRGENEPIIWQVQKFSACRGQI